MSMSEIVISLIGLFVIIMTRFVIRTRNKVTNSYNNKNLQGQVILIVKEWIQKYKQQS